MDSTKVVAVLSALAQKTRLEIFRLLMETGPGGMSAGAIAKELGVVASTLSHHLSLLEQAQLVTSTRSGRHVIYASNVDGARLLVDLLGGEAVDGRPSLGCAAE